MTAIASSVEAAPKRRSNLVLAVLAVVLFAIAGSACMPAEEATFMDRTNRLRSRQAVPALIEHPALVAKAEAWAHTMAQKGTLSHSDLRAGLDSVRWNLLGENVGVSSNQGDPLLSLHQALVNSPGHYANLMDRRFTHMGVGVATGADGRVWVAEVFARI